MTELVLNRGRDDDRREADRRRLDLCAWPSPAITSKSKKVIQKIEATIGFWTKSLVEPGSKSCCIGIPQTYPSLQIHQILERYMREIFRSIF